MTSEFDWRKLLQGSAEGTPRRRKGEDSDIDAILSKIQEDDARIEKWMAENETRRGKERQEFEQMTQELETRLGRLESIDREISRLHAETNTDQPKIIQLLYERMGLLAAILRSRTNIPEGKATEYYRALKIQQQFLKDKKLCDAKAALEMDRQMEAAYADYYCSQMRLEAKVFNDRREESGHGFLKSTQATELADRIISYGEKFLELSGPIEDTESMTVSLHARYEVCRESIIMNQSPDRTIVNVRIPAKSYFAFKTLETLIHYGVFRQKMDLAGRWEKQMQDLDIGFRLKCVTSVVEEEIKNWRTARGERGEGRRGGSSTPRQPLPDFVQLLIAGVIVTTILFLGLAILFGMGL